MISTREAVFLGLIDAVRDAAHRLDDEGLESTLRPLFNFAQHVRDHEQVPDPMPAGWNRPAPAELPDVIAALRDALEHVELGDSFEGFVQWVMPGDDELEGHEFGMIARYRVGNLDGQGGMRVYQP